MKYQRPIVLTIAGAASARCQNGSTPTHDVCKSGTGAPGTGGTICSTGYEADGAPCSLGIGVNRGCTTGYAADKRCNGGSAVGANKSACNNGGTANACNTGTKVTG
jgi:hypothetical protein